MTDQHLDPAQRKKTERRLLWSAFLKYTAIFVAAVWMAYSTAADYRQGEDTKDLAQAIRDTQTEGSPLLLAIQDVLNEVRSCTDPDGKCYKRGTARTAETVASLNEVTVVAAGCAAGFAALPAPERVIHTQQCVIERLAAEPPEEEP